MTRPFRFGVTLQPVVGGRAAWADAVKVAEQSGFSCVTVMDHFRSGGVWSALVAAHEAAPGLRLGTLVLNNDLSHPLMVAREAITADVLTGGAIELGVGAGWDLEDYRAVGAVRQPGSDRVDRLGEAIEILRQACAGRSPRLHGTHYTVEGPDSWPTPAQPRIPLLVGGGGKRVLELAARTADIVGISRNLQRGMAGSWRRSAVGPDGGQDRMDERIGWVREAAGTRFPELELHAIVGRAIITRDRFGEADSAGRSLGLTGGEVLASPHFLVGAVAELVEDLESRRERWGISYWTLSSGNVVGGNDMKMFASVIARLRGA